MKKQSNCCEHFFAILDITDRRPSHVHDVPMTYAPLGVHHSLNSICTKTKYNNLYLISAAHKKKNKKRTHLAHQPNTCHYTHGHKSKQWSPPQRQICASHQTAFRQCQFSFLSFRFHCDEIEKALHALALSLSQICTDVQHCVAAPAMSGERNNSLCACCFCFLSTTSLWHR